jgi:hypothetical protein
MGEIKSKEEEEYLEEIRERGDSRNPSYTAPG